MLLDRVMTIISYTSPTITILLSLSMWLQWFPDKTGTDKTGTVKTGNVKTGTVKTAGPTKPGTSKPGYPSVTGVHPGLGV